MTRAFISIALLLFLSVCGVVAQNDGDTTAPADTQVSNADFFFVACADQAVVNFSGLMLTNRDIYYQVFAGSGGTGTPLTNLRQVQVDGNFAFSEQIPYINDQTLGAGAGATLRVLIASESSANNPEFESSADDVQDGCASPQNQVGSSVDIGGGEQPQRAVPPIAERRILTPQGTLLNETLRPEDVVVVGARPSETYRAPTAGLIFAECDKFPLATPGIVYNTDPITIYWSWFVESEDFLPQHLENSNYSVKMNTAPLENPTTIGPVEIDGLTWFFYTVDIGNLRPGHYEIEYRLTWDEPISDGFNEFGPGTANEIEASQCNFDVVPNPAGGSPIYRDQYFPTDGPVHDIQPQY